MPDVMAITKWSIRGGDANIQRASNGAMTAARIHCFTTCCGPAHRKQSAIRRSSPSKNLIPVNIRRIVAEAVFVERGVNLFGQPKWVVAVIFDTGVRVPTWW